QYGVAEEFVGITMKLVGPRLGHHIDDRAGVTAELGVKSIGENSKLLDRVRRRLDSRQVSELVVGVASVYHEVVRPAASAVYRNRSRIVAAVEEPRARLRLHAGLKLQELVSVAGIQGQLDHGARIHHGAELGAGSLDQRSGGLGSDHLYRLAELHFDVDNNHLPQRH